MPLKLAYHFSAGNFQAGTQNGDYKKWGTS